MTAAEQQASIRSILLAPGNQPDLIRKLPRAGADVSIVCLEDGTPVAEKDRGRELGAEAVRGLRADGWDGQVFLRVNAPSTEWFDPDVASALDAPYDGIVLPMVSAAADLEALARSVEKAGGDVPPLILGLETGWGVIRIEEILEAAPTTVGLYFGAEDYATSIGAVRSESNVEVAYARARVALHGKVRGLSIFDQGTVRIADEERFRRECDEARGFGYTGKICVTPGQARLANELFLPTADEVEWSRRLLAEYEKALTEGRAAPAIDGMMIDGPLVVRARLTLERAGAGQAE
jgi:citrate lyase subunit beta / citryl-CoA lyase